MYEAVRFDLRESMTSYSFELTTSIIYHLRSEALAISMADMTLQLYTSTTLRCIDRPSILQAHICNNFHLGAVAEPKTGSRLTGLAYEICPVSPRMLGSNRMICFLLLAYYYMQTSFFPISTLQNTGGNLNIIKLLCYSSPDIHYSLTKPYSGRYQ